jgi:hypothetical protein
MMGVPEMAIQIRLHRMVERKRRRSLQAHPGVAPPQHKDDRYHHGQRDSAECKPAPPMAQCPASHS